MHSDVKKYADLGDIKRLKYIFLDSLDVDPTFEDYEEDYEYASKVPGLVEPYEELTPLIDNQSQWNENYWITIKRDLLKNFSIKRFEHMKKVARVIHADKLERIEKERVYQKIKEREACERERLLREIEENNLKATRRAVNTESIEKEVTDYQKTKEREARERERLLREIEESNMKAAGQEVRTESINNGINNYQRTNSQETQKRSKSARTPEGSDMELKKIVGIAVAVVVVGAVIILLVK